MDLGSKVEIHYETTLSDVMRAGIVLSRRSRLMQVLGVIMVVFALATARVSDWTWAVLFGLLAFLFLSGAWSVPFAWYSARRRPDIYRQTVDLTVDASGLRHKSGLGDSNVPWSVFRSVHETGDAYFLDTGAGMAYLVPKRAFKPEEAAVFKKLLVDAGLRAGAG